MRLRIGGVWFLFFLAPLAYAQVCYQISGPDSTTNNLDVVTISIPTVPPNNPDYGDPGVIYSAGIDGSGLLGNNSPGASITVTSGSIQYVANFFSFDILYNDNITELYFIGYNYTGGALVGEVLVELFGIGNLMPSGPASPLPQTSAWTFNTAVPFYGAVSNVSAVSTGFSASLVAISSVTTCSGVTPPPSPSPAGRLFGKCGCSSPPGEPVVGHPITLSTGNMYEEVTDYQTQGQNKLGFTRYYNGLSNTSSVQTLAKTLGVNWRSIFDRYLNILSSTTVVAERANGQQLTFTRSNGAWTTDTDVDATLTNSGTTWTLTDSTDTVETYTAVSATQALLQTIKARTGYTQTLSYNSSSQVTSVTDSYNRALTFTYSDGLLQTVTTPDGLVLTYGYNSVSSGTQLISVAYSTSPATSQTYVYENATVPFALTGIIDEDGNRFATWSYDASGRALSSQHAGGADLTSVSYDDTDGSRTVTNALGVADTYKFATLQGVPKVTEIDRAATTTTAAATELFTYDANGYTASQTDWNGNTTTYINDTRGQPTTINDAVGTAQARTTTITYDAVFVHLPDTIVTPGITTSFAYDTNGNPLTKTLTDTTTTTAPYSTSGTSRTWTFTWSNFLLASAKGPRTDVTALTTYTYDNSGALTQTTNALNQSTQITVHLPGGLPETIVDPNGVVTNLVYDARLRLLSSAVTTTAGVLATKYSYDAAGNLLSITLPDGSALTNAYDAAHRLTGITDLFSQNIAYTLDALGDRTQVNVADAAATIQRKHAATFDALGRVLHDIGGAGQTTAYAYDANGNALTITDPLQRITQQSFDALNRQIKATNPAAGITSIAYDAHDRPLSITDPNGNITTYVYDGFGDVIEQVSPVTGTTVYHYDLAGNPLQSTDANGSVAKHTYDALNRITGTTYPANAAENVTYNYDQTGHGFGIGRMTTLTDAAGTLSRSYDERGNGLSEQRVHATTTLLTTYTYDAASRVASITYPLGYTAAYSRDTMGRLTGVMAQPPVPAAAQIVASGISYKPFGPSSALSFGNGVAETRSYDLDYRLTGLTDTGTHTVQNLTYAYDAANNVLSVADGVTAGNSQTFGYDVLNRLTSAVGGYGSLAYTYDSNGNRLSETPGGAAITTEAATLDGLGSVSGLLYNQASRLATVMAGSKVVGQYAYDAFGQRLVKTEPAISTTTLYSYDRAGHLLEESNNQGNPAPTDYIYLDDGRPIATVTPIAGNLYFFHDDRLGAPQMATDSSQTIDWSTMYQAFGLTGNIESSLVQPQNLRLPGQEFDPDSGFYHNGFRDYVPGLGRYLESDPIGLVAGLNSYEYASGNPENAIDPTGLDVVVVLNPNGAPVVMGSFSQGHVALLVGNDTNGWSYYSVNGGGAASNDNGLSYSSLDSFSVAQPSYSQGYRIATTEQQDSWMKAAAESRAKKSDYDYRNRNCADFVRSVLMAGGVTTPDASGFFSGAQIPKDLFETIIDANQGGVLIVFKK